MLAGLIEPTSGHLTIDGFDLARDTNRVKARLGIVPQDFAFYPTLSARENLAFFGRMYGLWGSRLDARMQDVLNTVQLSDRAREPVSGFSNGMKRRLNIAIGLVHEPSILILDEPTVGVDAQSRNAILGTLELLNTSGVTILYTTHYMEEAARLCKRVAVIDCGRLIALDTPTGLKRGVADGLVFVEFASAVNDTLLRMINEFGHAKVIGPERSKVQLETGARERALKGLVELAEESGVHIKSMKVLEPSLETVYLHLTGKQLRDAGGNGD
jgi:ABC-2 type transport system ATP-binding protein